MQRNGHLLRLADCNLRLERSLAHFQLRQPGLQAVIPGTILDSLQDAFQPAFDVRKFTLQAAVGADGFCPD